MTDEAKYQRAILDAEEIADRAAPTFGRLIRTADGVRIRGTFPKVGEADEKEAERFVPWSDIKAAANGADPLVRAIYAIEDEILPVGFPKARTYQLDPK